MKIFLESEIFLNDLLASTKVKCCYKTCRKGKMLFGNYRDFGYNNSQVTCCVCFFFQAFEIVHLILITHPAIILFWAYFYLYSFFVINWPDYGFFLLPYFISYFYILLYSVWFASFFILLILINFSFYLGSSSSDWEELLRWETELSVRDRSLFKPS